jgi:hypothetical protein
VVENNYLLIEKEIILIGANQMKIDQLMFTVADGWQISKRGITNSVADLVIAFGQREILEKEEIYNYISSQYKGSEILIGSTSGEIMGDEVFDETVIATAIKFDRSKVKIVSINIKDFADSYEAGRAGTILLPQEGLRHLFVISDGQLVNGTKLVEGIQSELPENVSATGGLAGDGTNFTKTVVGVNSQPREGEIALVGFYGENIKFGFASRGGWDPFGPMRLITKSKDNILYELDGKSALAIYKNYLGEKASGLPGTALLFPLALHSENRKDPLVRTVLAVNEADQSMIFAGNIPEGEQSRFMKANFDRLVEGADQAAETAFNVMNTPPELAILISCVGRKIVLGERIEEEVEVVSDRFGRGTTILGFYSYGEISPFNPSVKCDLHNQSMTITTISEK